MIIEGVLELEKYSELIEGIKILSLILIRACMFQPWKTAFWGLDGSWLLFSKNERKKLQHSSVVFEVQNGIAYVI